MVDAQRLAEDDRALELLVIVNPDSHARRRIRNVLGGRIDEGTRILVFDYFEEFARFLEGAT